MEIFSVILTNEVAICYASDKFRQTDNAKSFLSLPNLLMLLRQTNQSAPRKFILNIGEFHIIVLSESKSAVSCQSNNPEVLSAASDKV